MRHQGRWENQIQTIQAVFQEVHPLFKNKKPVDRCLTTLYRKNKKYGSRDRRYISGAIFGYYRWYGWLSKIGEKNWDLSLFLGYVLDGNPVDSFIEYWGSRHRLTAADIKDIYFQGNRFEANRQISARFTVDAQAEDLTPSHFGKLPTDYIKTLQTRPGTWVRSTEKSAECLTRILDSRECQFNIHPRLPSAFQILSSINLSEISLYRKGEIEVQDISSQAVGLICDPQRGETWWDVCAGSGGKALHLSDLMENTGIVHATEIEKIRYQELIRRVKKNQKRKSIIAYHWDGITPEFDLGAIDGILVDAPCSCSGLWRRSPELRWNTDETDIARFSRLQFEILNRVCGLAPVGCTIVYVTCSMLVQENENLVQEVLSSNQDVVLTTIIDPLSKLSHSGYLNLVPPEYDGNTMFVAKMVKTRP